MIKKCPGCGSVIQYKNKNEVGYSPKENAKYCERCFKLKNYNQKEVVNLKYNNSDILNIINKKAHNVFFVTDFLNLSQKVIDLFNQIKVKNKYLLINKTDLIPNSINKDKYLNWIKDTYKINEKIILLSAIKKHNIRELNNLIENNKKNYICGVTNSGKSSIINELSAINNKSEKILTSLMPNTTLDEIKINLNETTSIYDTPGFIIDDYFDENLHPKKFLKPVTLQIKNDDTVSVNEKIYIKNLTSTNSFTFYMSNEITIKKVYDIKVQNNDSMYIQKDSDIVIFGYGFINIKEECEIILSGINDFEIRKSMF